SAQLVVGRGAGPRDGHQLHERREPAGHAPAASGRSRQLLLVGSRDVRVKVELVRNRGEEVEVAERDAAADEGLDLRLAAEPTTFRARREAPFYPDGDLREPVQ